VVQEEVTFYGHSNIKSLHPKSIELTKDQHLTPRGDCIIGVKANKACADLEESVKRRLKSNTSVIRMELIVGDESFLITGRGDERLTVLNPHDIVIRTTNYVCPRTMSVLCDKGSSDIPRNIVKTLQYQESKGTLRVTLE
jgi:hypothetical protein